MSTPYAVSTHETMDLGWGFEQVSPKYWSIDLKWPPILPPGRKFKCSHISFGREKTEDAAKARAARVLENAIAYEKEHGQGVEHLPYKLRLALVESW